MTGTARNLVTEILKDPDQLWRLMAAVQKLAGPWVADGSDQFRRYGIAGNVVALACGEPNYPTQGVGAWRYQVGACGSWFTLPSENTPESARDGADEELRKAGWTLLDSVPE